MRDRRATQKDVALLAGVSQATVSMAVSGVAHSIPAETLEKIASAARELGYVPNRFAQALKTNRTMTIACVVPDITNPFYPALMHAVQSVCEARNYDVIAVNTDGLAARESRFLDWARQGRVDGVVGVFWTLRATDFRPLIDSGVPVVRIESARKSAGAIPLDNIFVDSRAGSRAMAEYLIGRGHRQIAMIAGQGGPQQVRVEGYAEALTQAGLTPDVVMDEKFSEEGGLRAARSILARPQRPTAIFAANDLMAIGAVQALREAGLRVPQDIAVAGFDDISAAQLVSPALTTVAQFQSDLGLKAAQILMERMTAKTNESGTALEMPFRLIERQST